VSIAQGTLQECRSDTILRPGSRKSFVRTIYKILVTHDTPYPWPHPDQGGGGVGVGPRLLKHTKHPHNPVKGVGVSCIVRSGVRGQMRAVYGALLVVLACAGCGQEDPSVPTPSTETVTRTQLADLGQQALKGCRDNIRSQLINPNATAGHQQFADDVVAALRDLAAHGQDAANRY